MDDDGLVQLLTIDRTILGQFTVIEDAGAGEDEEMQEVE